MSKSVIVRLEIEEVVGHRFGYMIKSWSKVDKGDVPKNVKFLEDTGNNPGATVFNASWGDLDSQSSSDILSRSQEEIDYEDRFLVGANKYGDDPGSDILYLEFDMDSYSKFVYVTKMEEGAGVVII